MLFTSPSPAFDLNRPPVEVKILSRQQVQQAQLADDILRTYLENFKPPEPVSQPPPQPTQSKPPASSPVTIKPDRTRTDSEDRHNEISSFKHEPIIADVRSVTTRLRAARIKLVATFVSICESVAMFLIIFSCIVIFSPLIPSGK